MADFLTQTFAGAAGGMARAFKFSAMQDAEERRAERREESQIKLLMKRSEQEQIEAQQKAKRNEAFMTLQLDKRLESQRKINELNIQSRDKLTGALIKGRTDIAKEQIKGRQKAVETGVAGRKEVAEIGAEVAREKVTAAQGDPTAAGFLADSLEARLQGKDDNAEKLLTKAKETASAKQIQDYSTKRLRIEGLEQNRDIIESIRKTRALSQNEVDAIRIFQSLDISKGPGEGGAGFGLRSKDLPTMKEVERNILRALMQNVPIEKIIEAAETDGVVIGILEE